MDEDRRVPGNQEVIDAIQSVLASHIDEYHAFRADELKVMVTEHRELYDEMRPTAIDTNEKVSLLVNEIYGTPAPTAADPDRRTGGMVELLRSMDSTITTFSAQAVNGGIPTQRKWSTGQWAFYGTIGGAFVAMATAIIVAVLGG